MPRDDGLPVGDLDLPGEGAQQQALAFIARRHAVAVALEGDQALPRGPCRPRAAAGVAVPLQREQVGPFLLPQRPDRVAPPRGRAREPLVVGHGGRHVVGRERRRGCRGHRGRQRHHLGRPDGRPVRRAAGDADPAVPSTPPELFPARRPPHLCHSSGRAPAATRLLRSLALARDLPDSLTCPGPMCGIRANLPSKGGARRGAERDQSAWVGGEGEN